MILHGPVSPKRATPKGQGRANQPNGFQIGGERDDRSGDAGCTHTDRFGPRDATRLGPKAASVRGTTGGDGDTASTTLEHLRRSAGILTRS